MTRNTPQESDHWLEQAFPQMHFLLLALEGDKPGRLWLEANSPATALFVRLLSGEKDALHRIQNGNTAGLEDLFELVDNDDLSRFLTQRRPDLHMLFAALRGDEQASKALKRAHPSYHRFVGPLRELHDRFLHQGQIAAEPFEESTAADMGCLVGELHLRQGEWEKAIEAFSRAIETQPSADLYEGRAKAYRGLAEQDMERAVLIRQKR
jgi:tetratricopeptide (TPR) repeat protein